jgi:hypothetical protein
MAQRQSMGLDFSQGVSALTPPLPTWSRDTSFPSQLLDLQIDAETNLFKEEINARDSREMIHRSALNLLVFFVSPSSITITHVHHLTFRFSCCTRRTSSSTELS